MGGASLTQLPYALPFVAALTDRVDRLRRPAVALSDLDEKLPPTDAEVHQPCPLCGHTEVWVRYRPYRVRPDGTTAWGYSVGQCPNCDLLYRLPAMLPERVPDLYSDGSYADFLDGDYAVNRRRRYRRTLKAFSPMFDAGEGRTLLDFGCGTGLFMRMARRRGFTAYGVDLAPDAVELARERFGPDRAFLGSVPRDGVPGEGFDVITMWSVLAHIPVPEEDLGELLSLLKPGGRLLILTVNADSLQRKFFRSRWNGFTPGHLIFWSKPTITRLLTEVGFDSVEFAPFYGEGIERGKSRLSAARVARFRRAVDRYDGGNMLRVTARRPLA